MRRVLAVIIGVCILFFIAGFVAAQYGWLIKDDYILYSAVVGGIASVVALLSLNRPVLSKDELKKIDLEALTAVTEASQELQALIKTKSNTEAELENLDLQRQEMEIMVRKASLMLFLQEQHKHHQTQITNRVNADP